MLNNNDYRIRSDHFVRKGGDIILDTFTFNPSNVEFHCLNQFQEFVQNFQNKKKLERYSFKCTQRHKI